LQAALGSSYTIERELGGGGMSSVFLAEENALGRRVVIKVLPSDVLVGMSVDRFKREIQLAAKLQQAQIVPVLSTGQVDGIPYYTMPFVDGESLRAKLARTGPLPVAEVVSILRDVTRALAYAHDHGVVHRDIKPDNILLSGGTAVVTDFGIAKAISAARRATPDSALTQMGTSIGTPAYVSPEQAAGDPDIDHRADIYSLGCMTYELLAGHPPFEGRTPQRTLAAHLTETPVPVESIRPDVPPALAALVSRCLQKDPNDRPQSASEISALLEDATTGSTRAMPAMLLSGPGAARRALLAYAGMFVVVALIAKAAVVALGLPDWVFDGAVALMVIVLPLMLATAYVRSPHLTWRRTFGYAAGAVGAFALAVVAIMILRLFGIGPAASLLAAGTMSARERLLVIDFDAGKDSSLAHVLTEAVRTNLGQSSVISIMPPTAVAAALQRMQKPPATRVDVPLAREIAQREGAKAIVAGSATPIGTGYVVSVRLVSADSGSDLAAFQKTIDGPSQLLDAIDGLTRKLRGRIGESLKAVRDAPALDQVTTGSLDALRKYAEAVRAADLEGDQAKAVPLLREAVAKDPNFAMAYRKLGVTLSNLAMPRAQSDSALTRAYMLRDRLPDKERYLTVATYYMAGAGRNRQKAAEAFERALALDPTDAIAVGNLANNLRSRRQYVRAESLYMSMAQSPRVTLNTMIALVGVLFNSGRVAAAESVYMESVKRFPNAPGARTMPAYFMYERGQLDSVMAFWQAQRASANPLIHLSALSSLAIHALLRGRLAEARRLNDETMAANIARGVPSNPLFDSVSSIAIDIWFLGKNDEGIRKLEAGLARVPLRSLPVAQRPYNTLSNFYAWAGRPAKARDILAELDAEVTDTTLKAAYAPARHGMLAEILLAEKKPLDAVKEIWRSDSLPDGPASECAFCIDADLGRAYDQANMPDSAIAHWEKYVNAKFLGRESVDASYLAGIRKRMGELYEAKGDAPRAAANYAAFIALWKNADPELQPKVQEAERKLARLKETGGR
jgi:eukaryotic-like serine/threonine-protein kinase